MMIATMDIGIASKQSDNLRSIVEKGMNDSSVAGCDNMKFYSINSDNEASVA